MIYANYVQIIPKPLERSKLVFVENKLKDVFGKDVTETDYLTRCGFVITVPQRLIYHGYKIQELKKKWGWNIPDAAIPQLKKLNMETLNHDTDIEVQQKDIVFFPPNALDAAVDEGMFFNSTNPKIPAGVFIRYDLLDCVLRGNQIIPINGNVLIDIPKPITDNTEGVVRYVGKPCRHRRSNTTNVWGGFGDGNDLKRGDTVVFRKHSKRFLDNKIAPTLKKNYYVMAYNQIIAKQN